ncbi:MAG TPA: carboxypeptidase regulatory-like domain-containing protein, partial [Chitinophagaceae bacterium]
MWLKLMLAGLVSLFLSSAHAQTFTVSGRLQDPETKVGVPGATVVLKSLKDSTRSFTSTTDPTGRFRFSSLVPDSFRLTASSVGYETLNRVVRVKSGNVFMGAVTLRRTSQELTGVTVTGRIPPAVQKGDTVQFNASQFKVNPDASAEDLARKIPGITVENGQVTANGENVRRVTIDGRELFGDDATAALRNLPAEVIDKIQVFDRLSDQAQLSGIDDGNTTKEINIITKANMRNGQFGRVYGGYGTDNRYSAGGNTTFLKGDRRISVVGNFNNVNQQNFAMQDLLGVTANNRGGGASRSSRGGSSGRSGGGGNRTYGGNNNFGSSGNFLVGQQNGINTTHAAGINFSDLWGSKTTVTGSYLFNNTRNRAYEEQDRKYYSDRVQSLRDTNSNDGDNYNHRINLRLEYRIAPRKELIITPNLSFQDNISERERRAIRYRVIDSTERIYSNIINHRESDRSGNNLNNTILYRQSFEKRGRSFTASLNTAYNKRAGETYIVNETSRFGSDFSEQRRFTDQSSSGLQLSANLIYTEPLSERSQLQVNYNPAYTRSKSDVQS